MRIGLVMPWVLLSMSLVACDAPQLLTPEDLADPDGRLFVAEGVEVMRGVRAANREIYRNIPEGFSRLLTALLQDLGARGIDTTVLAGIDFSMIRSGDAPPMPGARWTAGTEDRPPAGMGSRTHALMGEQELATYYECPLDAPEDHAGSDCNDLVQAVVVQVQQQAEQDWPQIEQRIGEAYPELALETLQYVLAWAKEAISYGISVASIYAGYEIQAASGCEPQAEAHRVAEALGKEQGWSIVEELRSWAFGQVESCGGVNTDVVAETTRRMARNSVSQFMQDNPVCVDQDLSAANIKLAQADQVRRQAIEQGIDERAEILRFELVRHHDSWASDNCKSDDDDDDDDDSGGGDNGGGGGDDNGGGDNGGGDNGGDDGGDDGGDGGSANGDPIVIDLDDDGLTFRSERLQMDWFGNGVKQSMTWVGPREGLLTVDLDGDGAVSGVHELIGCRSDCGGGKLCFDGITSLRSYDRGDRGGNGDGRLDERDRVFSQLRVWVDADGNGASSPAELTTLEDRGVLAFDLQPQLFIRHTAAATLAGSFSVLTRSGFRTAYDVWFKMSMRSGNLAYFHPKN